jgi:hypothetical protein
MVSVFLHKNFDQFVISIHVVLFCKNKNVYIYYIVQDAFLEKPSPGTYTLKVKILQSQITQKGINS